MKPSRLVPLALAVVLAGCAPGNQALERATARYPVGREAFDRYNCAACHSQGEGGYGPRLIGNRKLRDLAYIRTRIRTGKVRGAAQMPAYPEMPARELEEVARFVRALAGWE